MKRLILIDGNNLMFRAYYATAYNGYLMENSKGFYTNAIYGFISMMNKIMSDEFTHILVAFDKGKQTFRHKDFDEYKGKRKPTPSEFKQQIPKIKEYLDIVGVKRYELELFEADDIIGTFAKKYENEFDEVDIISNDKDLLQLISDNVSLKSSRKGFSEVVNYNKEYLFESMQVTPNQIIDLKGLMGDSSDNIPGIPGVGEKTAIKLLKEYGNLENILENMDSIKGKLGEKIRNNYEMAIMSKKIATIDTNTPCEIGLTDIQKKEYNMSNLIEFYKDLEFHSFIKRLDKNKKKATKEFEYKIIDNEYDIKDILINNSSLHLETYEENYHKGKKLGFGISNELGNFYLDYDLLHTSIDFRMWLEDENMKKQVFDYKKIKVVLLWDNYDIKGVEFDLLLSSYIINPNNIKNDFRMITSNFDYDDVSYDEEIYNKGAKKHIPELNIYSKHIAKKAFAINCLKDILLKELKENNQYELLTKIEIPLSNTLAYMEYYGIDVDLEELNKQGENIKRRIDILTKEIYGITGEEFNISSPKQLGVILFEKMGLPHGKKTKTGYSTSVTVLESLLGKHEVIEKIIEYRMLTKLHSTYIEGIRNSLFPDKKVHTIFKQTGTSTGRLSSVEPNLQNIPIRYEIGRQIRKLFVPSYDNYLLAADYSQIELRVLAHMADVKELIVAFKSGEDIHTKTAREIFNKEEITPLERRQAKAVNFGIIYGMSAWGLSEDIHITPKQAERFIEKYYETFPGIKEFMNSLIQKAETHGFVETVLNRRRYINEIKSSVYMQRQFGKRMAMNAPIQGSAADIIKVAMVDIQKEIIKRKLKSKLLIQIHDELVFEVDKNELELMIDLVRSVMENCYEFKVPLKVDLSYGKNLYETK